MSLQSLQRLDRKARGLAPLKHELARHEESSRNRGCQGARCGRPSRWRACQRGERHHRRRRCARSPQGWVPEERSQQRFHVAKNAYTYLGFWVDEVDEDELDGDPQSVEKRQIPVLGEVVPSDRVSLTTDGEDSLDGNVHDHKTLGTESVGQNLESVGDKQTRPGKSIAYTKEPHKGNLCVSGTLVCLAGVLVDGAGDGPANERHHHTSGCAKEEGTTSDFVNQGSGICGYDERQDTFTTGQLHRGLVEGFWIRIVARLTAIF